MRRLKLILIATFFLFLGCSNQTYLLPQPHQRTFVGKVYEQIGVKQVKLPEYLMDNKFLIQKDGVEAKEVEVNFVESLDSILTKRTIEMLKSSLDNPKVFLYPWEVKRKRGYIVGIEIENYIYRDGKIVLEGSYEIKDTIAKMRYTTDFRLSKPSSKDKKELIKNLNELYSKVVLEIAEKIAK
jgi:uncharacterized lipoprotein YmbA